MKIFVGGVNASGKTTLLKRISQETGYTLVHGAGLLMGHLGCSNDYEKLRQCSDTEKDIAMVAVNQSLAKRKDNVLLDSHYLMLINGKVSALPHEWFRGFDAFVLVTAPLDSVWERMTQDLTSRDRALFQEEATEEQKEILRVYQEKTAEVFKQVQKNFAVPGIRIENGLNIEQEIGRFLLFLDHVQNEV